MFNVIEMIVSGILWFGLFPILMFSLLLRKRKQEAVSSMYIAYALSLGYVVFAIFFYNADRTRPTLL